MYLFGRFYYRKGKDVWKMKKTAFLMAIVLLASFVFTGCGSLSSQIQSESDTLASSGTENSAGDTDAETSDASTQAAQGSSVDTEPSGNAAQNTSSGVSSALAEAVYPVMAQYPLESEYYDSSTGEFDDDSYNRDYDAWLLTRNMEDTLPDDYEEGLSGFYSSITRGFLSDTGNGNRIISPINLYLALGMLSEISDGDSRDQILELLNARNTDTVRTKASALWEANYRDDGVVTTILADSLWLDEDMSFNQDTLNTLAVIYYTSSYQGEMGSDEFTKALQNWLDEQTGGLLDEQASGISLDPSTVLALASTIYYKAAWADEFMEENTSSDIFHATDGDIECDFMHQSDTMEYVDGSNFQAVRKSLSFAGDMWFILPDSGVTTDEIVNERGGAMDELFNEGDFEQEQDVTVNLSMPKFDVSSDIDLVDGLKALGVTDIFDPEAADFSPLLADVSEPLYVSQAEHAARVTVDEAGVEAAAFTVMAVSEMSMGPPEEVDFTLDRPFIFVITGEDDVPLFVGVVNHPM